MSLLVMYGTCIYKGLFYVSSKVVLLTALNATGDGNYDYIYMGAFYVSSKVTLLPTQNDAGDGDYNVIYMGAFYVSWCSRKTVPRVTRGFSHVKRSLELLVVEVT